MSLRILTMAFSCTSICSANDDRLRNWLSFSERAQDSRLDGAGQHLHGGVGAEHRAAGGAVVAGAAEHRQTGHDVIAGLHIGDVGADLLDDAGRFMAEHRGQRMRIQPFHEMQVGMTEAGDAGADQDLARAGIRHADILDHQRLVDFIQDGGLHRCFLFVYLCVAEPFHLSQRERSERINDAIRVRGSGLSIERSPHPDR